MQEIDVRRDSHHRTDPGHRVREGGEVASLPLGAPVKLSVFMAAHDEERTIGEAMSQVLAVDGSFDLELIVVDDGSTDGTLDIMRSFDDPRVVVIQHDRCRGKGAAILSAADTATGTHVLVFDADLEYSAVDIPSLLEPVLDGSASVVYGARVPGMRTVFPSWVYALGSRATTVLANLMFGAALRDMHTCLKLMPLRLFRQLRLGETGFGLDTEMTCEMLRRGIRPFEVPCSYHGRSVADGKKISARDGVECILVMLKVRFRAPVHYDFAMSGLHALPSDVAELTDGAPQTEFSFGLRPLALRGASGTRFRRTSPLSVDGGDSKAL